MLYFFVACFWLLSIYVILKVVHRGSLTDLIINDEYRKYNENVKQSLENETRKEEKGVG